MIPSDPRELDLLAAEHVLGTLDARQTEEVQRAIPVNRVLRAAIEAWETRLAPMAALTLPEPPPPELWRRVEKSLAARSSATIRPLRRDRLWKAWSIGATTVAAGLAAIVFLRPAEPARMMTVLLTSSEQPAWLVEAQGGGLRLASLNSRPVEPGKVRQLWALPPGATVPTSLGLIAAEAGSATIAPGLVQPQAGMLIEITLEPPGGSPTGRPTGPVLFIGRLARANQS